MSDQSNPNEQQIRDALRGVAQTGGPIDEGAAWSRISAGIATDGKDARRRRVLLGGAGLAIAGAAAALVLVVGTGDDEEAVEVGPAAESTTTSIEPTTTVPAAADPDEPEATTTTAPAGSGLPANPLAVVVQLDGGNSRLDLYDADTGALVTQGLAETVFSFSDVSVLEDGTVVYTEEGGDSSTVRMVPWDGSAEPVTPFGLELDMRSGTFSPDGSLFAFVEQGIERPQGRIGILPVGDGGDIRYLEWAEGEEDFFLTQGRIDDLAWSPDGTRLAFVSNYEGAEVRVVDLDAASLSDSEGVEAGTDPAWFDDQSLLFVRDCCFPDFAEPSEVHLIGVGIDIGGASYSAGATDVTSDAGLFAIAELTGGITVVRNDGDIREEDVRHFDVDGGTVVAVGL